MAEQKILKECACGNVVKIDPKYNWTACSKCGRSVKSNG